MKWQALRGFRDFYPEEMALRRYIEGVWHDTARRAGFQEMDGPPLEPLELYKVKSGDAIVAELYAFCDKGGRDVALRPEMTPTLARMAGEKAAALPRPIKWYAVPQLFRYERQQRGRLREHIQWNVDIMGAREPAADAEIVWVAVEALRRLGLTEQDFVVRVNHRALVEQKLSDLGFDGDDVPTLLGAIDKHRLDDEDIAEGDLAFLAHKKDEIAQLRGWLDEPAAPEGELGEFFAACEDLGCVSFAQLDRRIVRGLAYYSGIVFEIWDRKGKLRAIAGGGRYDSLIEKLGGPDLPALGFGMGDVVLSELLKDRDLLPDTPPRLDAYVVPIGDEAVAHARRLVRSLRDAGLKAEAPYRSMKVGKALKTADAAGARRAFLLGKEEIEQGKVKVKDLATGDETLQDLESAV